MSSDQQQPSTSKTMLWAGRVVSMLPVLGLVMSAVMKFMQPKEVIEGFEKFGYPLSLAMPIGIVELICTVLYIIPQTAVLGAILLTGYLGGAISTHVRISDEFSPPVIMGVLLWLGLFLRDARVRALIPLRKKSV